MCCCRGSALLGVVRDIATVVRVTQVSRDQWGDVLVAIHTRMKFQSLMLFNAMDVGHKCTAVHLAYILIAVESEWDLYLEFLSRDCFVDVTAEETQVISRWFNVA